MKLVNILRLQLITTAVLQNTNTKVGYISVRKVDEMDKILSIPCTTNVHIKYNNY